MDKRYIVFVWHLHQPYYGIPKRKDFVLPWVRLHGSKSYFDMVWMLKKHPNVRGTFNFSGALLRQINEYVDDLRRDEWWNLAFKPTHTLNDAERRFILQNFFSASWERCIDPYPRYRELLNKRGRHTIDTNPNNFTNQDFLDLKVWFTLAWFGFAASQQYDFIGEMRKKGFGFTEDECQQLLNIQIEILASLKDLYKELLHSGQIEISITPMFHPILPLIIDTDAAAIATPNRPRPRRFAAPIDAEFHVAEGLRVGSAFFQKHLRGMWPAEGSVSPSAVDVFARCQVRWIASDEQVLQASRRGDWNRDQDLYHPWRLTSVTNAPAMFFRDHVISDQLGFVYSKNSADVAVNDFMGRIRSTPPGATVSVILDGENPWEYYENDGFDFLETLYTRLEESYDVVTTTPSQVLDFIEESGDVNRIGKLDYLHSGSWIYGNYQIWIGHPEENRAWDLLNNTRRDLDKWEQGGEDQDKKAYAAAWDALHVAEGSDWFWWFGDDFQTIHDSDFDRIFRYNLIGVYTLTGHAPPVELSQPIGSSDSAPAELSAPYALIHPVINGLSTSFYKWRGAGIYQNTGGHGSMFENTRRISTVRVGFNHSELFIRCEPSEKVEVIQEGELLFDFEFDPERHLSLHVSDKGSTIDGTEEPAVKVASRDCFEMSIPFERLGVRAGETFRFTISLVIDGAILEQIPAEGTFKVTVPDDTFEGRNWFV